MKKNYYGVRLITEKKVKDLYKGKKEKAEKIFDKVADKISKKRIKLEVKDKEIPVVELYNFYVVLNEGVSETHYYLEAHYPHKIRKPTPRCVLK